MLLSLICIAEGKELRYKGKWLSDCTWPSPKWHAVCEFPESLEELRVFECPRFLHSLADSRYVEHFETTHFPAERSSNAMHSTSERCPRGSSGACISYVTAVSTSLIASWFTTIIVIFWNRRKERHSHSSHLPHLQTIVHFSAVASVTTRYNTAKRTANTDYTAAKSLIDMMKVIGAWVTSVYMYGTICRSCWYRLWYPTDTPLISLRVSSSLSGCIFLSVGVGFLAIELV